MNPLRPRASRRRFEALVLGALCAASCTAQNPDRNDGGDAAPTNSPDSEPFDSSVADRVSGDSAPIDAAAEAKSSSSSSSSGGTSSTSSSSGSGDGSAGTDASVDADASPQPDAGVDATVDTGSMSDTGVDTGNDANACVHGATNPNQVIMIGDSYLDPLFSAVGIDIMGDAQNAGALAPNMMYRQYAQGGAAMSAGTAGLNIPYQYEVEALMDPRGANIDTVIMDGGQSDFLLGDRTCLLAAPTQSDGGVSNMMCYQTIQGVTSRLTSLMQEMAQKGVKHIVYFFYPHLDPNGGGLLTMPAPAVNETIDYAAGLAQDACESVPQCLFVDPRAPFDGNTAQYLSGDRVNPSGVGAQALADLVWRTMVDHCIAQ